MSTLKKYKIVGIGEQIPSDKIVIHSCVLMSEDGDVLQTGIKEDFLSTIDLESDSVFAVKRDKFYDIFKAV